jgi:serine/threonine protein kinase/Flp pilus assembly protein TadD
VTIKCPKCNFDNPDDALYCGKCATPLPRLEDVSALPTITRDMPQERLARGLTFAGRYEIIEEIGKGGMGTVYRVEDKKIKGEIALKLIKPEIAADRKTIERFRNELRLARKIAHRNVCRMYDLGEEAEAHYITMEYVPGENLQGMIRMMGQLSPAQAISIAKQVCEGLAEAHSLGVVHRDLKSGNIMIDKQGNARIMDFGIARSPKTKGIAGAEAMISTPEYMSPEQVEGEEVDQRSDIYSLGVTLFEMVTGKLPFEGETPLSVAAKQKTEPPPDPKEINTEVPVALSRIILKCMEKDKEERYQTAEELYGDLIEIEEQMPSPERAILKKEAIAVKKGLRFRKWWIAVVAFCMAVVGIGLGILLTRKESTLLPHGEKMLVVLPFKNLGPVDDEYFADGLTEELTSRLSALQGLGIISRTSARLYKNTTKTIKQIGEELGVDYVLEGTVRWDRSQEIKGRVRVTPQLIRVSDDTHLWSDTFDGVIEDIFSVQSEIAEQVVKSLDITVLEPERKALFARPTDNIEAYDLYLRAGESIYNGYQMNDINEYERGIALLEKAIELDSDFILAYVYLANVHTYLYLIGLERSQERQEKAREVIDELLELAPNLPETQWALMNYYFRVLRDYDRVLEIYESMKKARPNLSPGYLGLIHQAKGNWQQAAKDYEEAFRRNPRAHGIAHDLGLCYERMRRYEKAEEWFERSLSIRADSIWPQFGKVRVAYLSNGDTKKALALLDPMPSHQFKDYWRYIIGMLDRDYDEMIVHLSSLPYDLAEGNHFVFHKHLALASVYHVKKESALMRNHADQARISLEKLREERPQDARLHASLGLAYAYLGRKEEAIREGRRAVNLYPVSRDAHGGTHHVYYLAWIYTVVGEYEEALDQLEFLMSIAAGEVATVALLRLDPKWDPLRDLPRFKRLVEENSEKEKR